MRVLYVAICSLTLSLGAAVGVNLQKKSMQLEKEQREHLRRSPFLQPLWCIGLAIIVLDACGDFVFIGMAPQSLLAPLGSLCLGWNIMLAPIFQPTEKVTKQIIYATIVIYIGTILTVLYADDASSTYNLDDIVNLMKTTPVILYFSACMIFEYTLMCHGERQREGYGITHYCGLAGSFGGKSIIFAKISSELIKYSIMTQDYQDWKTCILPYMFLVGMLGTVTTQLNYLNYALEKFDALVVVPLYQSFWNAFGITGGLIFFQEYKDMSRFDSYMYTLGVLITFAGVAWLVMQRSSSSSTSTRSEIKSYQSIDGDITEFDDCTPCNSIDVKIYYGTGGEQKYDTPHTDIVNTFSNTLHTQIK